ncbi:outer membrane protein assembly factor BamD [Rheinheimera sp. 4Y26]|uniref:outer membrane protein assembly factor BamD n=1 Tax=Rheinheimera sp. 4Y26 TaxID=2977811 RepID=UPI0021B0D369|nr:outer membrane protein assembly factor BamD [Rheinheimera sp. 4Y26]MCT6700271.1 outer membrane protein assembly factor BamD [Rheinheimera sp. 4Y26]
MKAKFFVVLCVSAALTACAGNKSEEVLVNTNQSAQAAYNDAKEILDSGLYSRAIELLKAMESRFPFGPIARQVQLDLIYAYHASGDVKQCLASIDRFIRLNPNHPDLDYVYYMRGLTNQKADENAFQEFFGIDRADRDMASTKQAFEDFKILTSTYPNSKYAADGQARMVFIKEKMARHEMLVADYYSRRGAHLAAANRAKYIVEFYRDSSKVPEALQLMITSYDALGLTKLRDDAKAVLALNFPQAEMPEQNTN